MLEAFSPWSAGLTPARPVNGLLGDLVQQMYPWRRFAQQELAAGRFPLWSPYGGGGTPLFANGQSAVLFPLNLATVWLPADLASTMVQLAKPPLAAAGTALFMRAIGASLTASLLAGTAWAFAGPMVTWLGWPHTNALALLPYLFWATVRWLQRPAVKWWVAHAVLLAIQLFGGHPETTAHSVFSLGIFVLCWTLGAPLLADPELIRKPVALARRSLRTTVLLGGGWGLSVGIGTALAGVQVVPLLEAISFGIQAAERSGGALSRVVLERETVLTWLVPNYFGTPLAQAFGTLAYLNYNETLGYVGLGTVALAVAGLLVLRLGTPGKRLACAGLVALTVIALGLTYGIPVITELRRLPGLGHAANTRFVFMVGFGLACLAGFGLDGCRHHRWLTWGVVGTLLAVSAVCAGLSLAPNVLMPDEVGARPLAPFEAVVWRQGQLWRTAGLAALWAFAGVALFKIRTRIPWSALVLVPLLLDMGLFTWHYNPTIERSRVERVPPAVEFIRAQGGSERVIALGDALLPNGGMLYGLHDLRVYDAVAHRRVLGFFEEVDPEVRDDVRSRFYLFVSKPDVDLLNLSSVRWVIAPLRDPKLDAVPWATGNGLAQRYTDDSAAVWEIARPRPRAYLTRDVTEVDGETEALRWVTGWDAAQPRGAVVERDGRALPFHVEPQANVETVAVQARPGHLELDVRAPDGGLLVVNDALYPGWTARVDGVPAPLLQTNYLFMGVPLSSGNHRVTLDYAPGSFTLGLILSGLGVLVLALVALAARHQAIRRRGVESD
jgi:hypothetical protein